MALLLLRQATRPRSVRYLFADSSPQVGRNWLWVSESRIELQHLRKLVGVHREMVARMRYLVTAFYNDELGLETLCCDDLLVHCAATLAAGICEHTFTPVALGASQGDVAGKAKALAHMMALENPTPSRLRGALEEVVTVTSDMGVEMHLSDFPVTVAPFWLGTSALEITEGTEALDRLGAPDMDHGMEWFLDGDGDDAEVDMGSMWIWGLNWGDDDKHAPNHFRCNSTGRQKGCAGLAGQVSVPLHTGSFDSASRARLERHDGQAGATCCQHPRDAAHLGQLAPFHAHKVELLEGPLCNAEGAWGMLLISASTKDGIWSLSQVLEACHNSENRILCLETRGLENHQP